MSGFKQMLKEYLMVDNMEQARVWVGKQPCGPEKRRIFLNECDVALSGAKSSYTYDKGQDYVDSLRRNYYVGIGL